MTHNNFHQIICDCHAFNKLCPLSLLELVKNMTESVKSVSDFLLSALELRPTCTYRFSDSSFLKCPEINLQYFIPDNSVSNSAAILQNYVDKGRSAIFTTNFDNSESIEDLIRYLTELALETDDKINNQLSAFTTKVINRIALAKIIETITKIKGPRDLENVFTIRSGDFIHSVTSHNRILAINLLGGKYFDQKPFTANFVVYSIPFGDIDTK